MTQEESNAAPSIRKSAVNMLILAAIAIGLLWLAPDPAEAGGFWSVAIGLTFLFLMAAAVREINRLISLLIERYGPAKILACGLGWTVVCVLLSVRENSELDAAFWSGDMGAARMAHTISRIFFGLAVVGLAPVLKSIASLLRKFFAK